MSEKPLLAKWRLLRLAAEDEHLTAPADFRVLVAVLDRMNDELVAWPGFGRIAADVQIARSTVIESIKRLVELGYLAKDRDHKHNSNRYRLGSPKVRTSPSVRTSSEARTGGSPKVRTGVVRESGPAVVRTSGPEFDSLNPSNETDSLNPPNADGLPDWLPADLWQQFQDHRKQIKKPMTEVAKTRAIAKLSRLKDQGHPPDEVLDQSIVNGWSGLFEIKGNQGRRREPATLPRETDEDLKAGQAEGERRSATWN